jgi:AmiR/NasT family two-component response regulator
VTSDGLSPSILEVEASALSSCSAVSGTLAAICRRARPERTARWPLSRSQGKQRAGLGSASGRTGRAGGAHSGAGLRRPASSYLPQRRFGLGTNTPVQSLVPPLAVESQEGRPKGGPAEGAGFEPAVRVNGLRFSRPAHSTALPPLRCPERSGALRPRVGAEALRGPARARGATRPCDRPEHGRDAPYDSPVTEPRRLRVLIADERDRFIEPIAAKVTAMGHECLAHQTDVATVGRATVELRPDVAIVALHEDTRHALELITEIVEEATCPVVMLADRPSREFLLEAAERGVFAHLDSTDETELEGGIDIALERYQQWRALLAAFERRARIERAKGVLMERHGLSERAAFERMRGEARSSRRPLIDVVEDVVGGDA